MGYVQHGYVEAFGQVADLAPHIFSQPRVQVAEGLVHEQQLGIHRQRPRQCHSLLLATAQQRRRPVGVVFQLHQLQGLEDPFPHQGFGDLLPSARQRQRDVLKDGHVGPDGVGLEHHADLPVLGRRADAAAPGEDRVAVDLDLSGIRHFQAGHTAQQRRLAGAARAQEHEELAFGDSLRDVAESLHLVAADSEDFAQILDFKHEGLRNESLSDGMARQEVLQCRQGAGAVPEGHVPDPGYERQFGPGYGLSQ